jgi:hypothetical protein
MSVDLSKLIFYSVTSAFKNNKVYTGTFNISGTTVAGTNSRSVTINLDDVPDMVDIVFNGPTDTVFNTDPRPSDGWFSQGQIWVIANGSTVTNYPTSWVVYSNIVGSTLTITMVYVQTFVDTLTLNSTNGYYRLTDYSVF